VTKRIHSSGDSSLGKPLVVLQNAPVARPLTLDGEELAAWLRLGSAGRMTSLHLLKLLRCLGMPQRILSRSVAELTAIIGARAANALLRPPDAGFADQMAHTQAWLSQSNQHIITLADPAYPAALLHLADPPAFIYLQGKLNLLSRPALAVVGSRRATAQGRANAEIFSHAFAAAGITVISGLALGIDGAAHRSALYESGGTLAVIGTGADRVYPAAHRDLARQIAEHGAIISEWPLGSPARAAHFPQRNRLIAALSKGVVVIEAALRSGSLITARLAAELGRDVFALPGSIHAPQARGCHKLIQDGARLSNTPEEILEEMGFLKREMPLPKAARPPANLDPEARAVLDALAHDTAHLETLQDRTHLAGGVLQATLLRLELGGLIAPLPGGWFERVHRTPPST
jgi:DNA processing protein